MFDPSAPHIIILLIVVLLLFGSTRLPGAAQALGKSLHIFRRSVKGLEDEKDAAPQAPARLPTRPRRRSPSSSGRSPSCSGSRPAVPPGTAPPGTGWPRRARPSRPATAPLPEPGAGDVGSRGWHGRRRAREPRRPALPAAPPPRRQSRGADA